MKRNKVYKLPLTQKTLHGYDIATTAKNSGQNWHSEFKKIHSRILHGFFCAYKIRYVMTDCIEESSDSPFSFLSGNANSVQPVALQLALKPTVSLIKKETA